MLERQIVRPLGWKEYQFWRLHVLPFGWAILHVPDRGWELEPGKAKDWRMERADGMDFLFSRN